MSCQPVLRDDPQPLRTDACTKVEHLLPNGEPRPAGVEMARVLKTAPVRMASDPASGAIAHWKHGALHDVVEPMADHVIMTYPSGVQRLERRGWSDEAASPSRSARRAAAS
jgi:AraC family transcriptional regulator